MSRNSSYIRQVHQAAGDAAPGPRLPRSYPGPAGLILPHRTVTGGPMGEIRPVSSPTAIATYVLVTGVTPITGPRLSVPVLTIAPCPDQHQGRPAAPGRPVGRPVGRHCAGGPACTRPSRRGAL